MPLCLHVPVSLGRNHLNMVEPKTYGSRWESPAFDSIELGTNGPETLYEDIAKHSDTYGHAV